MSFKINSETWTDKYDDTESQEYKDLTEKIVLEVGEAFNLNMWTSKGIVFYSFICASHEDHFCCVYMCFYCSVDFFSFGLHTEEI